MDLYVFDNNIKLLGIIDKYESYMITERYQDAGEFSLSLYLGEHSLEVLSLLKIGHYVYKTGEVEAGIIETIHLGKTSEGKTAINIQGGNLTSLLNRRIHWGRFNMYGKVEDILKSLLEDNFISPSNPNRAVPGLTIGALPETDQNIRFQTSFGNILSQISRMAKLYDFGFRIMLDVSNQQLVFLAYKGKDKTIGNNLRPPVIFGEYMENILKSDYNKSIQDLKNTALIAGAGEGADRFITELDDGIQGWDRLELYVDARDVDKTIPSEEEGGEDEEIPDDEYRELLIERAREKLEEHSTIESFDGIINPYANHKYTDITDDGYYLGDKVTYLMRDWNIQLDTEIKEVTRSYEENGENIEVVFGEELPTLIDKIRRES